MRSSIPLSKRNHRSLPNLSGNPSMAARSHSGKTELPTPTAIPSSIFPDDANKEPHSPVVDLAVLHVNLSSLLSSQLFLNLSTLVGYETSDHGNNTHHLISALNLFAHAQLVDEHISGQIESALKNHDEAIRSEVAQNGGSRGDRNGKGTAKIGIHHGNVNMQNVLSPDIVWEIQKYRRSRDEEWERRMYYFAWSTMMRVCVSDFSALRAILLFTASL